MSPRARARARRRRALALRRGIASAGIAAALGVLLGLAFAGSPTRLASGVRIAGVDVGGLEPGGAQTLLERRAKALSDVPVVFVANGRRFRIRPSQLGVRVDWHAAVEDARREGEGFGPVRGFKRLDVRVFGADVAPATQVYRAALDYELKLLARRIDRSHRDARIALRGLRPVVLPGRAGAVLDRRLAAAAIVRSLAAFGRTQVALPVRSDAPRVTAAQLAPVAARVRLAVSAPVRLALAERRFRIPRWRIATLLELPANGSRRLRIGGPIATRWFAALAHTVGRPPRDADFAVNGTSVRIVPARPGYELDVRAAARAILRAATRPRARIAKIPVALAQPKLTTARARTLGITGLVSSYTTVYGGDPNRIHNVQLVAHLVDKHLIAPGETFSFNETTGDRSADKGFLEAPVIINGELKTGLGGGVCQVSTTVFNAAYEAGLRITERTNHALYISHYPQGRDATVNYPDVDLKFVNDTPHWLLLRTFVGSSTLTVSLYGTPVHRKVVSETSPLVETAAPPTEREPDPSLTPGTTVLAESGEPARQTSVHRQVFSADGKLLYDDTWSSYYRAEPRVLLVGPPKPKPKPAETTTGATTTTSTTSTSPTTTRP